MQMFWMMNDKDEFMLPRCNTDKKQMKVFANRVMFHWRSFQNKMALFVVCAAIWPIESIKAMVLRTNTSPQTRSTREIAFGRG